MGAAAALWRVERGTTATGPFADLIGGARIAAQQWLDQMPLRDNPERSASPSSETWQAWIERGKRLSNIAQTLGQILSSGSDPVTRSTAALALGFVGTTESITLLSAHLATDVPQVQMEAAVRE